MTRIINRGIEEMANVKRQLCYKSCMKFRELFAKRRILLWLEYPSLLGHLLSLSNSSNILHVFIPRCCGYIGIYFKIRLLLRKSSVLLVFALILIKEKYCNVLSNQSYTATNGTSNDWYTVAHIDSGSLLLEHHYYLYPQSAVSSTFLTVVLVQIQVFWNRTSSRLINFERRFVAA